MLKSSKNCLFICQNIFSSFGNTNFERFDTSFQSSILVADDEKSASQVQ